MKALTCLAGCRSLAVLSLTLLLSAAPAHESLLRNIEMLNAAIDSAPDNAALYIQRGELQRLHRSWNAAETDFRHAAALDADAAELDFRLGRLYFDAGRDREAQKALEQFVAVQPQHPEAWIVLARIFAGRGEHVAAASAFARGITDGTAPEILLERSRALVLAGQGDLALAGLDAAIAQRGPLIVLELEAIDLELEAGRVDAALSRLGGIAARVPRQERWLARRGAILEQANRPDEARLAYTGALQAVDALPASRRATPAVVELESRIRDALRRLPEPRVSGVTDR